MPPPSNQRGGLEVPLQAQTKEKEIWRLQDLIQFPPELFDNIAIAAMRDELISFDKPESV